MVKKEENLLVDAPPGVNLIPPSSDIKSEVIPPSSDIKSEVCVTPRKKRKPAAPVKTRYNILNHNPFFPLNFAHV